MNHNHYHLAAAGIVTFVSTALLWALFSFVHLTPDPAEWGELSRFTAGLAELGVIATVIAALCDLIDA